MVDNATMVIFASDKTSLVTVHYKRCTEYNALAESLSNNTRVTLVSNLGQGNRCPGCGFRCSPLSLQANDGIELQLWQVCFLSNNFQRIIYLFSYHSTLYGLWYWELRKINHLKSLQVRKCYSFNRQSVEKIIFCSKSYDPQSLSLCVDSTIETETGTCILRRENIWLFF
jgi:hypothetical protein